jgi:hypothetical protein
MRGTVKMIALLAISAGILFPADGLCDAGARYDVFVKRNPFALKDPPPPPPPPPPEPVAEPEAPMNLKLTGITTLFKRVRIFLVNSPPNETPESFSIYEGERKNGIEVLEGGVDISAGTVRVRIDNFTKTLSFETDGLIGGGGQQAAAVPAPKGAPLRIGARAIATPNGPSRAAVPGPGGAVPAPSMSFKRPLRAAPRPSTTVSGVRTSPRPVPVPAVNGNVIRLNAQGDPPQNVQPPKYESTMTAEEQVIISKANELYNQENPPVITHPKTGETILIEMPPLPPIE